MRKEIYLAIIERLKEIEDNKIKHFDLWNQQIEFIEQETPFDMPAVFIEFQPIQWQSLGGGVQQATIGINLHVVTEYKGASANDSGFQTEALAYFDLLDDINKKMYGMKGKNFHACKRVSSATNHNHEEIIENIEVFTIAAIDR